MADKSITILGQEENGVAFDQSVTLRKEVDLLKEQTTETAVEPVTLLTAKSKKIIVHEEELHLNIVTNLEDSSTTDHEVKGLTLVTSNLVSSL